MTRAEKQRLHSEKCTLEVMNTQLGKGPTDRYVVSMSLTAGEFMALNNALSAHSTPVGEDVMAYLRNAAYRAGIQL
jgi:hypothetical protein